MKKAIALLLILTFLFGLCACQFKKDDTVEFYYQRLSVAYGAADGVIASETREAAGHTQDLRYLLSLYLRGPLDVELESPFPAGCGLVDIFIEDGVLSVMLDSSFASLTGIDQTIASACLAKTCFGLANISSVCIETPDTAESDPVHIIIDADSLLLEDNIQETQ